MQEAVSPAQVLRDGIWDTPFALEEQVGGVGLHCCGTALRVQILSAFRS